MDKEKLEHLNIKDLLTLYPAYKEIAGDFSLGKKHFAISEIPLGIQKDFYECLSTVFDGGYIVSQSSELINYEIIKKSVSYTKVLQILADNDYERVDSFENDKEFLLKGDLIYINDSNYINPIRIDFWGEDIEDCFLIDEITFKPVSKLKNILLTKDNVKIVNMNDSFSGCVLFHDIENYEYLIDYTDLYSIHSNLSILEQNIDNYLQKNYKVYISTLYKEKLKNLEGKIVFIDNTFLEGFQSEISKIVVYTDSEIFDSLIFPKQDNEDPFCNLDVNVGDYIVHKNHGVAIYDGIKTVDVNNSKNEYLILNYAKGDKLYVPRTQFDYVSRYVGTGHKPKLTRLGTNEWFKVKKRVQKSLESITEELLELYAKRELQKGFKFSENKELISKFVDSFEHEETGDQKKVWGEISVDMENSKPMDRLLVGDVGFGKTELAMRSAFKAILDGKQVAFLAPTTVLVEQHYSVLKDRFADWGINIGILSRFQDSAENSITIKKVKDGEINIVVGTHRLLSHDVEFKDLGLLIIDEEQRFGVKQKERLKMIRENVDVLSMTATPIPRSLNMALSGIKDISILLEPPVGRRSVKTSLLEFDYENIVRIINAELERGGQVYFIHNRVQSLDSLASRLKEYDSGIKYVVGHGQMSGKQLSQVMRDFNNRKYDVLISTTIIENGIDMPNVNTILIDDSQNLGLSQLHQLRGRVGRSDVQAYCYLIYPKGYSFDNISGERLKTLVKSQNLGAGFQIASKDLEIRGGGNFLGREQSGNIASVGYSLYVQILKNQIKLMRKMS